MRAVFFILCLCVYLALVSCSESDNNDSSSSPSTADNRLNKVGDPAAFLRDYKQALIAYYENTPIYTYDEVAESGSAELDSSDDGTAGDGSSNSVSETNLQEQGVDEADSLKIDGTMLYALTSGGYFYPAIEGDDAAVGVPLDSDQVSNKIRAFRLLPDSAEASLLSELDLETSNADGMYLYRSDDQASLIVTGSSYSGGAYWYDSYAWQARTSYIKQVDITDSSQLGIEKTLSFDGGLISSRRVGDYLIAAVRYFPAIEGIHIYPQTEQEKSENRDLIQSLSLRELLPAMRVDDGGSDWLVRSDECYVSENVDAGTQPDVISLFTVNLNTMTVADSHCYVGASETFYASTDAVYLATTRYKWQLTDDQIVSYEDLDVETDLHEFLFDEGQLVYSATGSVKGHLGWNPERRPFRLSAKDGDLRVVSFTAELEEDKSPVRLTVLRRDGDSENSLSAEPTQLETLAQLPNEAYPQPLGKPGEQLYASRFVGDKAYFVTFLMTDPLYVIDLSDPANPYPVGELFVDGYSDYLHPVGEDLLIAVGKDAIAVNSNETTDGNFRGAWYQGVKISLIDVSDPSSPKELAKRVIGQRGTESNALYDHHAFTYLASDSTGGLGKLAIPLRIHGAEDGVSGNNLPEPFHYYDWTASGLFLLNVDETNRQLLDQGMLTAATATGSTEYPLMDVNFDRSLLFGESVYYFHNNSLYSAFWSTPDALLGPK